MISKTLKYSLENILDVKQIMIIMKSCLGNKLK